MATLEEQSDEIIEYFHDRFVAIALLVGSPEPLERFNINKFLDAFEQVFGQRPEYKSGADWNHNPALRWLNRYHRWYRRNKPKTGD